MITETRTKEKTFELHARMIFFHTIPAAIKQHIKELRENSNINQLILEVERISIAGNQPCRILWKTWTFSLQLHHPPVEELKKELSLIQISSIEEPFDRFVADTEKLIQEQQTNVLSFLTVDIYDSFEMTYIMKGSYQTVLKKIKIESKEEFKERNLSAQEEVMEEYRSSRLTMSMTVRKKIELILVRTILSLLFKYLQTSVAWDYLFSFMKDKVYIVEQVILTSGRNIYPKELTSILNTLRYLHPKIVSQRKTTGNEIIHSYVQSATAILPPEILADLEAIFQNPGKQDLKDFASLINYYDSKYATHLNTDSNLIKELRAWLWMEEEEKLVVKYCDRSQRQHFQFDQLLSTHSKEELLLSESVIDQLRNIFYRYRNGLFNEGGTVLSLVIDSNMVVSMYAEMERVLLTGIQSDKHFNAEIAKKLLSHALLIFVQDLYCYQLLAYHLLQTNPHQLPYARTVDCKQKNIVPKNDYEYQVELIELFLNVIQPDEKELFRDSVSYWPEFLLSNTSEPEGAIKQEEEKKSAKVENDTTGVEIVANIRQYIQNRFQPDLLNQSKDISHNHSIKKLFHLCHTFFHGNDRALSIFPAFLLHSILYHDSTLFPNISSHNFERLIQHFNSCITNELEYFFILSILVIPTINPKDKISDLMRLSNHETFTQIRDSYQKLIKVLLNCEFELAAFVKNDGHSLQKVLYQTIPDKKYQRMKLLMNLIDICVLKLENYDSLEPSLPHKTLITDEEFAMFMDKIDWLLQNQQMIKSVTNEPPRNQKGLMTSPQDYFSKLSFSKSSELFSPQSRSTEMSLETISSVPVLRRFSSDNEMHDVVEVQVPQSEGEDDEVMYEAYDSKEDNLKEEIAKDIGWGFTPNDRSSEGDILNHYFSSFPISEGEKTQEVSCFIVFDGMLFTGFSDGTICSWDISTGNLDNEFQTSKEGKTRAFDHTKKISGLGFTKTLGSHHSKMVSTSWDCKETAGNNIIIWDYDGKNTKKVKYYKYATKIACLHVTRLAPFAVFASDDKKIHVWDLDDPYPKHRFQTNHTDRILSLGTVLRLKEQDSKMGIISVGWDKQIIRHTLFAPTTNHSPPFETPQSTKVTPGKDYWKSHVFAKGHSKGITCVEVHFPYGPRYRAIKPDGGDPDALDESQSGFLSMLLDEAPILLTGSLDNTIIIWDFENAGKIRRLKGHLAQVHAIKVSDRNDDGLPPIIISASADCSIILWDLVYGRRIRSIQHSYPLTALSIEDSAAGIILFSTDQNAALVWDLRHTKRTKRFKTGAVTTIDTYSTTNAEDKILVGCVGNEYYVCSLNNSTSKNPTSLPVKIPTYHEIRINATVVYQPKITKDPIIISGDAVGKLSIWTIARKNDKPQSGTPKNLPLSLQADRFEVLAIGLYDPYVFGRKRGSSRINTTNDTRFDLSIPFVIVSGTEKMLRFYDFTGQYTNFNFLPPSSNYLILEKQSGHQNNICSIVVFHPTEKTDPPLFLTGSHDGTVKLWDLETLAWLRIFSGEQLSRIHSLVVYDPAIQFPSSTTTTEVTSSVFKEEEQSKETALITAADDGKVCIWSLLKSNQEVGEVKSLQGILRHSFQAHQEAVTAVALYIPKQTEQHPLLVTGSTDKLIHIWDLFTREKLNTLIGHHDRVCWLKVYDPPHLLHPMLFSGGDDEQTIVWKDFLYGTSFMPLRDMVRNAFIADYQISMCDWPTISSLAKQQRDPYSFFAENSQLFTMAVNYHRSDFLIQFFDYLVATLPTIQPCFYCRKKENTSNTEKEIALPFSSKHAGIGSLFCSDLFHQDDHVTTTDQYRLIQLDQYERVTEKNIDFLQHSSEVIHLDLLKLAILKSETRAVHIIVLAWLKLLNQDMDSILMQRIFHPMYYLPLTTIKCLFEHCPNEFVFFIRNLRLIQSHDSTMGDIPREMKLARRGGMEIRQSNRKINTFKDFWKPLENRQERAKIDEEESFVEQQLPVGHNRFVIRFLFWLEKTIVQWWEEFRPSFFGKPAMEKEVSSMIVPFRSCKDLMIYLQWFVTASDKSDDLQIFNSEVVTVMVRYLWFVRGRRRHLVALLKYLMFFMIFLSCITFFEPRHGSSWRVIILNILTATFLLVYYGPQIQLNKLKFSITGNQIGDLWDILELITVLLGLIGMIIRLYYYDTGTTVGRHLLAVSAVGMWFKILYFLRPFSTTGPLVAMIIEIAGELFAFFVILFSLFTGIIFGFWFLSSSPSQPNFLLKEVDYSRVSTTILMGLLFGIIILIIVINFCLTIIGNILTRIKQRDTAWLMKERAKVMLKVQQSLENHYDGIAGTDRLFHFKNYLLVLKYREEVKKGTIDIAKELEGYLTQNEIQLLRKVSLSHEG